MERESYSDPEIAVIMNANFVSVKVDREEGPDVGNIHMAFVEATTGNGGRPMNVWLTPNLKPFVGGLTSLQKTERANQFFEKALLQVADAWKKRRDEIVASSKEITSQLQNFVRSSNSFGIEG